MTREISATGCKFLYLLGNHETTGVYGSAINALQVLDGDPVLCVTKPVVWNDFVLMPYFDRAEDFVKVARSFSQKRMICHQSFNGAQFQEGFYDPNGVDPDDVPQQSIVSGHIHLPQRLGTKIWYPGAPRWKTLSDANVERAIYICEYDSSQVGPVNTVTIPTDTHCRAIYALEDRPGAAMVMPEIPLGAPEPRIHIDVYGSPDHIRGRMTELDGSGYRIRTFPDQVKKIRARESDGIGAAMKKYVDAYEPRNGSTKADLQKLAAERVPWLMA